MKVSFILLCLALSCNPLGGGLQGKMRISCPLLCLQIMHWLFRVPSCHHLFHSVAQLTENPACLWGSTSSTAFFGWLSSPKNPFQQHRDDYLEVCGRPLYFASTNHRGHAVSPLLLNTFIASPGSRSFFSIAFLGVQKLPHNLRTRMRQIPQ